MNCPNCKIEMTSMTLDAHLSAPVTIDVCIPCQAFWFDKYESLKLSPGSTLKLLKLIGEHSSESKPSISSTVQCPRCDLALRLTHDLQRSTRFSYWRCPNDHGRFTSFFDFLREKNFIRNLTAQQIDDLKQKVQSVNCANCGAPIDLANASACTHCGTPISILDVKQSQELLDQLKHAAEPKPIDPSLPLDLALVKARLDAELGPDHQKYDSGASGLVESLSAFARWLTKSGV
jgi:hypothetical protein